MIIQIKVTEQMIKACKSWVNDVQTYRLKSLKRVTTTELTGYFWWRKEIEVESYVYNQDLKIPPLCRLIDMHYNILPILHEPETEYTIHTISKLKSPQVILLDTREFNDINELMEYYK